MKKSIAIFLTLLLFLTSFLPFLDTPLTPQKAYAETCVYFVEDGLGNVRFLTNSSGSKVKQYDYDPFGNIRASIGASNTNYRFSSEQLDSESGMYFLRARYYDPSIGRFITRDPVKGLLTNPQSQNPYAYALNNPVNLSDPSGKFIETLWDVANIAYDIYTCDWTALGVDTAAAFIPFVPAGITKVGKAANVVSDTKRFTPDQGALVDLAKEAKRTGISNEDANTLLQWADEYNVPHRGPEVHPNRPYGQDPHIHIGPVDHIFIK